MTVGNKRSRLALLAVAALVILGAASGYLLGFNRGTLAGSQKVLRLGPQGEVIFFNRVVKSISQAVEGRVKSIEGDRVTLEEGGDSLTFVVGKEAKISRLVLPKPGSPPSPTAGQSSPSASEEVGLAQIKRGERVSAFVVVTPAGYAALNLVVFGGEE